MVGGAERNVAAERGASILPRIGELGLTHVEIADNATMLRMVAGKRVPAAAVMTSAADAILVGSPDLGAVVTKRGPPIESKFGYVMLSKRFYADHKDLAECFWTTIREIRATPRHAELIHTYVAETP